MDYKAIIAAGYKTEAAYVASLLKKELKAKFPLVKFSVKSDSYSMGDSVRVSFTIGANTPKVSEVEAIAKKFQGGSFDGMTDMYTYTYKGDGPTTKYMFVDAICPDEIRDQIREEIQKDYGITPEQWNDHQFMYAKFQDGSASSSLVYREIRKRFYEVAPVAA